MTLIEAARALLATWDHDDFVCMVPVEFEGAIDALRIALTAAEQPLCHCKDRPLSECPGEWEPGCDLGSNPAHVRVHHMSANEQAAMKRALLRGVIVIDGGEPETPTRETDSTGAMASAWFGTPGAGAAVNKVFGTDQSAQADPWRSLYQRAINEANGLTNYVEDRPELRSAERRISKIEDDARAIERAHGIGKS